MADLRIADRFAPRNRWILGLATSARLKRIVAALMGVDGSGLAARAELLTHDSLPIGRQLQRRFARLRQDPRPSAAQAALLAAHLAESQAQLLEQMAPRIAPLRDRVSARAVADPGLWRRAGGLVCHVGLCDAARLAEFSGSNVIDDFAVRNLAQDGRGRPLLPVPTGCCCTTGAKRGCLSAWSEPSH